MMSVLPVVIKSESAKASHNLEGCLSREVSPIRGMGGVPTLEATLCGGSDLHNREVVSGVGCERRAFRTPVGTHVRVAHTWSPPNCLASGTWKRHWTIFRRSQMRMNTEHFLDTIPVQRERDCSLPLPLALPRHELTRDHSNPPHD